MLPLERLEKVRAIYVHENSPGNPCPDGVASALVLRDAMRNWGKPEVRFVDHNRIKHLFPEEGALFCDIAPSTCLDDWRGKGAIVIDHHEHQRDVVESFKDHGVYKTGHGISGAWLAYEHVWSPMCLESAQHGRHVAVRDFALTAAVRDSWFKNHQWWEAACEQAEALRFWPWSKLALESPFWGDDEAFARMMEVGSVLREKRLAQAQVIAGEALYHTTIRGTVIAIVNSLETSDVADYLPTADVLVGFRFWVSGVTKKCTLSMRARGGYDVGALAKSLGGGGHRAAAGCTIDVQAWYVDPYVHLKELVSDFESKEANK